MRAFVLTITAFCWSAAQAAAPMLKTRDAALVFEKRDTELVIRQRQGGP